MDEDRGCVSLGREGEMVGRSKEHDLPPRVRNC